MPHGGRPCTRGKAFPAETARDIFFLTYKYYNCKIQTDDYNTTEKTGRVKNMKKIEWPGRPKGLLLLLLVLFVTAAFLLKDDKGYIPATEDA